MFSIQNIIYFIDHNSQLPTTHRPTSTLGTTVMLLTFYEVYGHLQTVSVLVAVVQYERPDLELCPPLVDLVQRVEHCLHRLYAALGHDRAAGELRVLA